MKALLIEFDLAKGRRPAGIEANNPKLQCYGWQNLEVIPAIEIRVIEDEKDIAQYEGREAEGLTVLHNDNEIQAAIDEHCKPVYSMGDEVLFKTHLEQRGIKLDDVPGENSNEQLQHLRGQGIRGILEIRRPTLVEVYGPPEKRAAKGYPV